MTTRQEFFYESMAAVQAGKTATYAEISEKQKAREALNAELEEFLKHKQITVLPIGFTHFPDGILPRGARIESKEVRDAKIEAVNAEVRKMQNISRPSVKPKKQALTLEQIEERESKKLEKRAQEKQAKKSAYTARILKQQELLRVFTSKAQFGDIKVLTSMLGIKNGISEICKGVFALSDARLKHLEECLKDFPYGEFAKSLKTSKEPKVLSERRKAWLFNRDAKKAALEKGEKTFMGRCSKEGIDAVFVIRPCGSSACKSCEINATRGKRVVEPKERPRSANRILADKARAAMQSVFTAECKKHGVTEFYVTSISKHMCKKCHAKRRAISDQRQREKNMNDPRRLELFDFVDGHRGRLVGLAKAVGVTESMLHRYKIGRSKITNQVWEKFQEYKKVAA